MTSGVEAGRVKETRFGKSTKGRPSEYREQQE